MLTALLRRGLIDPKDGGYVLTAAGYAAIGHRQPASLDDIQVVATGHDLQLLEGISVRRGNKLAAMDDTPAALKKNQIDQATRSEVPAILYLLKEQVIRM